MEGNNSTKTKLIKAGIKLFSQYGYAATSTRMIASEAEVNLSAIAFHYFNKERLYVACLEYMLEKVKGYYAASYMEIAGTFKQDAMTPQKAYEFLEKLIDLQIEVAFAPQYKTTLALIYWENNGPGDMRPLSAAAFDRQERVMAELIQTVAPVSQSQAIIASRHINGSIISFGEHRGFIEDLIPKPLEGESVPLWIREEIKGNCLAIVQRLMKPELFPPHPAL